MTNTSLVAGNLVFGSSQPAASTSEDLLDSLLFAQLFADEKISRFSEPEQWFAEQRKALINVKWQGTDFRTDTLEVDKNSKFTIESLVERALISRIPSAQAIDLRNLMARIVDVSGADAQQFLYRHWVLEASPEDSSNDAKPAAEHKLALQMSVVGERSVLSSLLLTFSSSEPFDENLLLQLFTQEGIVGDVAMRFFQLQWNSTKYISVRSHVQDYLQSRRLDQILPLCLEEPAVIAPDTPEPQ